MLKFIHAMGSYYDSTIEAPAASTDEYYATPFYSMLQNTVRRAGAEGKGCDLFRVDYLYDRKESYGISTALKRAGFVSRSDPRNLVLYRGPGFREEASAYLDLGNWYVTDLYFDGY